MKRDDVDEDDVDGDGDDAKKRIGQTQIEWFILFDDNNDNNNDGLSVIG